MNRRLLIFNAVLLIAVVLAIIGQKEHAIEPSAVIAYLPESVGEWRKVTKDTDERVRKTLGHATNYVEATYVRPTDNESEYEAVNMFIVLSGDDLNSGIHRPERCFPAQGFVISSSVDRQLALSSDKNLKVRQLTSSYQRDGVLQGKRLAYYWFCGREEITNSHYHRTWIDVRDRLVRGKNQQWAYILMSADHTLAEPLKLLRPLDETEAQKILDAFAVEIFPNIYRAPKG